jgi:ubiquitin-conjugating enzyme E2 W
MMTENLSDFSVEIVEEQRWVVTFEMPASSLYPGETHRLEFTFCEQYPIESPQVKFLLPSPEHTHVYSNGHICLNILYDEWSPALTVKSVIMSLISMLHSAAARARPPDDLRYCGAYPASANPKNTRFLFDDDAV